jgi:hypothetical protein
MNYSKFITTRNLRFMAKRLSLFLLPVAVFLGISFATGDDGCVYLGPKILC